MRTAPEILETAINVLTTRGQVRDKEDGERSMALTVDIFNTITEQTLTEHEGWQFMIALKLARMQQGGFNSDDYLDLAAYSALLGECAIADKK